jgi:predicted Na+-dependent transporter
MKTREFVTIGLKIMAVYVFFQVLMLLPLTLSQLYQTLSLDMKTGRPENLHVHISMALASYFLVIFVELVFAVSTFFSAHWLARFFVADQEDHVTLAGPVSEQLLTAAFQCLGVYALTNWTPELVHLLFCYVFTGLSWFMLISPAVGVLIGLLLLFKAKGLLRLIRFSRPMFGERTRSEGKQE